ncbi:MAG TPA: deoxyribonuclease IV [Caldithrix sp.]|nr:deoxyribonuclease IV [Calditrichaceae bacterium]HEM49268.1 deoxyribonuclease IV [Caldithrix sp.]HES59900.1 deoxyribonuclease IV [Caldithrix sp.]
MKIGCHISIRGGIENSVQRASELGCESFQIFTQNQRQWISKIYSKTEIQAFRNAKNKFEYKSTDIISHGSYLINLCANEPDKLTKSRQAFLEELKRCDALGISAVVIHPGAHGGNGNEWGIKTIADSLNEILKVYTPHVKILLETIAGQGTGIGYTFEQLAAIRNQVYQKDAVGFCLDTCHIFSAGYAIRNDNEWDAVIRQINAAINIDNIKAIHLNDCKYECGSKKDRHAAISDGYIGFDGFRSLINRNEFKNIPAVLEVPGGDGVFRDNIKMLKAMRY